MRKSGRVRKSTINSFRSCSPRLRKIHGFVRTMTCARHPTTTASVCSMLFFPAQWFLSIGIRTVPRMSCCFMENWPRCFTRKSGLETALNRSRTKQLGVVSMKRHALSWTRPPAITAASSQPASGTRSKSWSRPSSMKPRTGSTAKTGARRCEFLGWTRRLCRHILILRRHLSSRSCRRYHCPGGFSEGQCRDGLR